MARDHELLSTFIHGYNFGIISTYNFSAGDGDTSSLVPDPL